MRSRYQIVYWHCILLGALTSHVATATQPDQSSIVIAGQLELARLLDLVADRRGVTIDYDLAVVKVQITLRSASAISDDDLWALVNQL
jgi:hypothetical protein